MEANSLPPETGGKRMTDIYQSALDAFGAESQIKVLFEEMAEPVNAEFEVN